MAVSFLVVVFAGLAAGRPVRCGGRRLGQPRDHGGL